MHTWGAVEVLVVVVLCYQTHSNLVLLAGLLSAQQTHIIRIQHHKPEAGERAEVVGIDVPSSLGSTVAPVGV